MICRPCRTAADKISQAGSGAEAAEAAQGHNECTDCDCQHKWETQVHGGKKA